MESGERRKKEGRERKEGRMREGKKNEQEDRKPQKRKEEGRVKKERGGKRKREGELCTDLLLFRFCRRRAASSLVKRQRFFFLFLVLLLTGDIRAMDCTALVPLWELPWTGEAEGHGRRGACASRLLCASLADLQPGHPVRGPHAVLPCGKAPGRRAGAGTCEPLPGA